MKLPYFLFFSFLPFLVAAQQEAILSQFFYNKTQANPAAAGTSGFPCLAAFHRQQWADLEGAPSTQVLSFNAPAFADRVGLGLTLMNDRIGFYNATLVQAAYAYRVSLASGKLAIGVQGSYLHHQVNWSEAQTISGLKPVGDGGNTTPGFNVGAGVHFENEHYFLSASVPHILKKGLLKGNEGIVDDYIGTTPHLFVSAGGLVPVSEGLTLRPAFASRFAKNTPTSTDLHLSFGFSEDSKLWLGCTYRWNMAEGVTVGDALVAMLQYRLGKQLRTGVAYEYSLGEVQRYTVGTYELMLEFCFNKPGMEVKHPRFF